MYVTECSVGTHNMTPESARAEMIRRHGEAAGNNAISQLGLIAGLCNAGEFDAATSKLPLHDRKINGDATDQAVLRFSESLAPLSELKKYWRKNFEISFNSKNKYMIRTLSLVDKEGVKLALPPTEASTFNNDDM
jgi:sodium/potassium-transporting ATPase subunit alpha